MRRFDDITQRAVILGADFFVGVGTAGSALLLFFVPSEIRRNFLPRLAPIARLQEILSAMVESIRLVLAPDDWSVPVETILRVFRIHSQVLNGRRHDVGPALCLHIQHFDRSLVTSTD